jgi:hypothetical protein
VLDLAARHTDDHAVLDALRAPGIHPRPRRGSTARRSRTSFRTLHEQSEDGVEWRLAMDATLTRIA